MNFIALKIILKINKKKIKTDPGLIFTQGTLLVAYYIYARYEKNPLNSEWENCDQVLKFSQFGWGYLTCNGSGKQTNRQICMNFTIYHPR